MQTSPISDFKDKQLFLDSIIENIPHMIFVKDAKDLKFVLFNKAGEDLLGIKREDMLGKNDYDFFPKEQADFFTAKDRETLAKGAIVDIAAEPIETKTKGKRILHTKKITIKDDVGHPIYLLGISEDITERIEQEKKFNQQVFELNQANNLMVNRELKMEELKNEIKKLQNELTQLKNQFS